MNAEKLTAERTIHWLKKTIKTINNMPQISSMENYRANELAIRYDELIDRAKELGVWVNFCEDAGFVTDHNGFDLFA